MRMCVREWHGGRRWSDGGMMLVGVERRDSGGGGGGGSKGNMEITVTK